MSKYMGGRVSEVSFQYSMYGATMGTVLLQGCDSVDDDASTTLWSKSGNLGSTWLSAVVDISGYDYDCLRFEYTGGSSYTGDFSLDNIQAVVSSVPDVSLVPSSSPSPTHVTSSSVPTSDCYYTAYYQYSYQFSYQDSYQASYNYSYSCGKGETCYGTANYTAYTTGYNTSYGTASYQVSTVKQSCTKGLDYAQPKRINTPTPTHRPLSP